MRRLFALVLLAMLLSWPQLHAAPQAAPGDSAFGLNTHLASRYPQFETLNQPAEIVRQLGIGWAREDVHWFRIEPVPGQFDWGWYDKVFALHQANGTNVIGVIGPAVGWATDEPGIPTNAVSFYGPNPDRYAAFAAKVAERYRGKVRAWEIWNEPDHADHWRPAPNPAAYAQLLIKASAAIRAVDPQVTILSGGVTPFDPSFLNALGTSGAWGAFDALSVHPYVDPFVPEDAQIGLAGVQNVQTLSAKYGSKPIWVTEFGWGTGPCERDPQGRTNEEQQANYLVRGAIMVRAAGAERVIWYNFKDRNQPCYGLVRAAGGETDYSQPKPALTALRVLSAQVGGGAPLSTPDFMPRQVVLTFDDASGWGPPYPVGKPAITASTEQVRSGRAAGRINYQFTSGGNDYVAFERTPPTALPANTTRLGMWVYGNGSGHLIQAQLIDSENEVLQYRLGFIGGAGWQWMSASLSGAVEPGNRITPNGNGRLDGAVRLKALVIDDNPDTATGNGTLFVDDLTAFQGAEVYAQRFQAGGNEVVDVLWSAAGGSVQVPSQSGRATITDRNGQSGSIAANNGVIALNLSASPIYLRHVPGQAPQPTPQPSAVPTPAPVGDAPQPSNGQYAAAGFKQVWERTDRAIVEGRLPKPRSWLWGPQPVTAAHREPYSDSPGGTRLVQYFDKSRMEINNPNTPQVTNGLLVVEMITGRLQTGDNNFAERQAAEQAVAGDPTNVNQQAPTYASFRSVAFPLNTAAAPNRVGQVVSSVLGRDGSTSENSALARYNVKLASYDTALGHNVPQVFVDFFNQRGLIYEGGYKQGQVINAIFAMGLPISEPYWARVKIGGVEQDVLMQAFQRRVLTYTPSNPAGFQVEMGNVGQHYLRWRYGL